jgi:hypothetical protein
VPLFSAAGFEPPARGKGAHGFTPLHTPAPSRGATPVACVLRRAPPKHIQGSPSTADASGAASTAPGGSEEGAQKKVKVKTVRKLRLGTASKNERSVVALDVPEQSLRGGTPSQNSPVRRAEVATPDEKTAALLQAYLRNPHHEMREADDSIAAGVSSIAPLPLRGAIAAKKRAQKAHAAVDRAIEDKAVCWIWQWRRGAGCQWWWREQRLSARLAGSLVIPSRWPSLDFIACWVAVAGPLSPVRRWHGDCRRRPAHATLVARRKLCGKREIGSVFWRRRWRRQQRLWRQQQLQQCPQCQRRR